MKKNYFLTLILTLFTVVFVLGKLLWLAQDFEGATSEGSSNNKSPEIYNGSDAT